MHLLVVDARNVLDDLLPEQDSPADDRTAVRPVRRIRSLDVQDPLQTADKIRPLDSAEEFLVLRSPGQKFLKAGRRGSGENEHCALRMAEGAVQGILAVLHGREEILEPAPGNTLQFGVELIEEDQRDLVLPPVQRFLQGLEQFHRVAVL